jgi:hypothetical protein
MLGKEEMAKEFLTKLNAHQDQVFFLPEVKRPEYVRKEV